MPSNWIFWVLFNLFVLAMLALDLGVFNRKKHVVKIPRSHRVDPGMGRPGRRLCRADLLLWPYWLAGT